MYVTVRPGRASAKCRQYVLPENNPFPSQRVRRTPTKRFPCALFFVLRSSRTVIMCTAPREHFQKPNTRHPGPRFVLLRPLHCRTAYYTSRVHSDRLHAAIVSNLVTYFEFSVIPTVFNPKELYKRLPKFKLYSYETAHILCHRKTSKIFLFS